MTAKTDEQYANELWPRVKDAAACYGLNRPEFNVELSRILSEVRAVEREACAEIADNHECGGEAPTADEHMLRLKACEEIAEGNEGWEKIPVDCPSIAAVAELRKKLTRAEIHKLEVEAKKK